MTESAVFPLSTAYLPGDAVSLRVFESRYLEMMSDVMATGRRFVTVLISRGAEVGGGDSRFDQGVEVVIENVGVAPDFLVVSGYADAAVVVRSWLDDDPYPKAVVSRQSEIALDVDQRFDVASSLTLLAQRARDVAERLASAGERGDDDTPSDRGLATVSAGRWWDERIGDPELWRAFWIVAGAIPCGPLDRCHFLEPGSLPSRVARLHRVLDHVSDIVAFRFGD